MSETGIGIQNFLFFIGVVENNIDPRLEGRVQCRSFGVHGTNTQVPTNDLPWAIVMNSGFQVPPLNAWVFGTFIDGRDCQQPLILGVLPTQMTSAVDPDVTGWGAYTSQNYDLLAQGSRPDDLGQPTIPKLARGEYLDETYIMPLEATKVENVPVAGTDLTWDEPGSAYDAQYPLNRVIETPAGHTIELDDTPGSERIMVYHKSGSYVQIDSRGTTTNKAVNDRYDISEENSHVYIGGNAMVTIGGDARVLVNGSMYHEVMGDYSLKVRGNAEIVASGQLNLQSADQTQIQGSRTVVHAAVADVDILASSSVNISGENTHISAEGDMRLSAGAQLGLGASGVLALDGEEIRALQGMAGAADRAQGSNMMPAPAGQVMVERTSYAPMGTSNITSPDENYDLTPELGAINGEVPSNLQDFIKREEGFRANAYWDVEQYSIGYGTKARSPNETITEAEALKRLNAEIAARRAIVIRKSTSYGYNWSPAQIDSMTSFIYNLGEGKFDQVTDNGKRSDSQIAAKMLEYTYADGKSLPVLVRRRKSESDWFRSGMSETVMT